MPRPGKIWRHVTIGTHNSWKPGDPRGWRGRNHKRHSSGEHRHPPPAGEHAGLLHYSNRISGAAVAIDPTLRPLIGRKLVTHFHKLGHEVLVIAVLGHHVHVLVELPSDREAADHEIGRCKQAAALAVKDLIAVKLWARKSGLTPIRDQSHQRNTYRYICKHAAEGAWVWTYREGEMAAECEGE